MTRTAGRVAIYAGTAAGVFALPFYVPAHRSMSSLSQVFHFNNQVAMAALLCGLALATWWQWRDLRAEASPNPLTSDRPLHWWSLLAVWAASSPILILIWLASGWCPVEGSCYFVNRLMMAQDGLFPYQDFEFSYGPAMIYIPLLLQRLTGVSIHAAYLLTLWLFAWGGMFLLWWVIRHAQSQSKTAAFLLLSAFPALNPESGLQYMLTRYVCGFAALILARIAVEKLARRWVLVALCHLILLGAVFSISQEVGLAFFAALIVYWLLEYQSGSSQAGSRWIAYSAAVTVGLLASLPLILPRAVFLSVRVFSSGGSSLPLFPSPYMLLYVGSLLIVIVPVLAQGVRAALGQGPSQGVFGTLTPVFAVHAVAMIPAALGRADAGHVLYNGTGVFLLALLTTRTAPWRPVYPILFALIFPVLALAIGRSGELAIVSGLAKARVVEQSQQHPALAKATRKTIGEAEWSRIQTGLANYHRNDLERFFPALSRYGDICAPFGGPAIFYPLAVHHVLQAEYYYAITAESPTAEVQRKMQDVSTCRYAIIPGSVLHDRPTPLLVDMKAISRLVMFPIWGTPKIIPYPPAFQFSEYVRASFVPLAPIAPGEYLCQRKSETP